MSLLQFSRHEKAPNQQLRPLFTTRRKLARRFSPALDGLEGRKLLSTIGYGAEFRMNPASPTVIQSMAPDVQKVREALPAGIGILKCPE